MHHMLIHSLQPLEYSEQIQEMRIKLKRVSVCQLPSTYTLVSFGWLGTSLSVEDKPVIFGEVIFVGHL